MRTKFFGLHLTLFNTKRIFKHFRKKCSLKSTFFSFVFFWGPKSNRMERLCMYTLCTVILCKFDNNNMISSRYLQISKMYMFFLFIFVFDSLQNMFKFEFNYQFHLILFFRLRLNSMIGLLITYLVHYTLHIYIYM